jgi:hypothetical protein
VDEAADLAFSIAHRNHGFQDPHFLSPAGAVAGFVLPLRESSGAGRGPADYAAKVRAPPEFRDVPAVQGAPAPRFQEGVGLGVGVFDPPVETSDEHRERNPVDELRRAEIAPWHSRMVLLTVS